MLCQRIALIVKSVMAGDCKRSALGCDLQHDNAVTPGFAGDSQQHVHRQCTADRVHNRHSDPTIITLRFESARHNPVPLLPKTCQWRHHCTNIHMDKFMPLAMEANSSNTVNSNKMRAHRHRLQLLQRGRRRVDTCTDDAPQTVAGGLQRAHMRVVLPQRELHTSSLVAVSGHRRICESTGQGRGAAPKDWHCRWCCGYGDGASLRLCICTAENRRCDVQAAQLVCRQRR